MDLRILAMITASDSNVKLAYDIIRDVADIPIVEVNKKESDRIGIALKQALNNAVRAVEGRTEGEVRMIPNVSTLEGLQDVGVQAHFREKGYGKGDNIASLTIKDNGSCMPGAVLAA